MKNIVFILVLIFSTMTSGFCQNDQNHLAKGLLWKISGNGLKEKSYLFGTWHGSSEVCVDFLDSIPNFYKTFDSVSQYVGENLGNKELMEGIMEDLKKSLGEQWMPQNTKYHDLLNKTDLQFLDSLLLKYLGTTSSDVNVRPNYLYYFLSLALMQKAYEGTENEKCKIMMDRYLQSKAEEKQYLLGGLDSPEILKRTTMDLFLGNYKPGEMLGENAAYLVCQLRKMLSQEENADLKLSLKNMSDAYRNMDLKNLLHFKNKSIEIVKGLQPMPDFDENYHFMVIGRNKIWMEKIPAFINEKSTFIAVGALHLCGDEGLINLLRDKGYTVKPVK